MFIALADRAGDWADSSGLPPHLRTFAESRCAPPRQALTWSQGLPLTGADCVVTNSKFARRWRFGEDVQFRGLRRRWFWRAAGGWCSRSYFVLACARGSAR